MNRLLRQGMPCLSFCVPYILMDCSGGLWSSLNFLLCFCFHAILQVTYCYPLVRTIAGAEKKKTVPEYFATGVLYIDPFSGERFFCPISVLCHVFSVAFHHPDNPVFLYRRAEQVVHTCYSITLGIRTNYFWVICLIFHQCLSFSLRSLSTFFSLSLSPPLCFVLFFSLGSLRFV